MSRARTIWKWSAAIFGCLVVLLAVAIGAFRLWLEHSPTIAPALVARVQRLTGLEFSFARLDARLGLYGPELVFKDARVLVPGQHDALVTAGAGRVGFDLWRSLRTGRLASGRVVLEGARLYVYVTDTGVELRGQGALSAAEGGAHLALGDLPVGHVGIEGATIWVQDLRRAGRSWRIDRVALDLERDPQALRLAGRVPLPDALGARLDVEAELSGDLAAPETLAWRGEVALKSASIAGWTALVPQLPWLPAGGRGDLAVKAAGRGMAFERIEGRVDLKDVVSAAAPGTAPSRFATLVGVVSAVHSGGRWTVTGRQLTIDPGHDAWRRGEFALSMDWQGTDLAGIALRSPAVRLEALAALVPLLPAGAVREAGTALAPRGALTVVDVKAIRGAEPGEWRIDGGLRFTGVGFGAWRALPGMTDLDGDFVARGSAGRVRLHSDRLTLALPRVLRDPVRADGVNATLDYWWRSDGWRFAADGVRLHAPDGEASGYARLWLPADAEESPRLVLDFRIKGVDARAAPKYLPAKTIPPKTMDWLDHAFLAGRVPEAHLEFAGETRRFPFRDGGGLFRVRVRYEGIRLHYQDDFSDIENAAGEAEFRNQGFVARATTARIAGLAVGEPVVTLADYHDAELVAHAKADGDVKDALHFLQSSPVGPKLGDVFMKLSGQGPFSAEVALDFPFRQFALRRINVDGRLERVSARVPGVVGEFRDLAGSFSLHDRELDVPQLTGTVLGGPLKVRARTVTGPSGLAGERVLLVEGQGRVAAAQLQPQLGITRGNWLDGGADWRLQARLPRIEWRPDTGPPAGDASPDAVPLVHDVEIRSLPASVRLDSSLAGLESNLPEPLAKDADEARPLRVELTLDPGLDGDAPQPPAAFRRRDLPRPPGVLARLTLGEDSGVLELRRDEDWHLARGTLRFGGGTPQLRDPPGVWIEGRMEDYDLSAWLRMRLSDGAGHSLSDVLRGGTIAVDRFGIFGFEFPDVTLMLEGRGGAWHAAVDGPSAHGSITVPWDVPGKEPLSIDMERLVLGERTAAGASGTGGAGGPEEPTDPTQLPAMAIRVKSLEIQQRRFGALEAQVSRTADGLQLDRASLKAKSFEAAGRGSWSAAGGGQTTALSFTLDSTDVLDTLSAWGFTPTLTGHAGHATADLHWRGGIDGDVFGRLGGHVKLSVDQGQLITVDPGAGRVLGLLSVAALPRHLTLDFRDLTDKGFAFDSIRGDFELRDGNAYTNNLVLKGPAAEIGIVGRTGIKDRDYDQTAKVTGHLGGPIAAAGALAAGPAVGAALLLFSKVFKEPLSGIARGYYRITGSWDKPKVERIGAGQAREATENAAAEGGPR